MVLCFSMTAALQAKPLLLMPAFGTGTFPVARLTFMCFVELQTGAGREARRLIALNGLRRASTCRWWQQASRHTVLAILIIAAQNVGPQV